MAFFTRLFNQNQKQKQKITAATSTLRVDGKRKGQGEKCPRAWKKEIWLVM